MQTIVDRELLLEFFLTFSRFEFALKATGLLKRHPEEPPDLPPAEPDWDGFAVSLRPTFAPGRTGDLQEACRYFLESPPNRQVLLGGVPAWETPVRGQNVPDVDFLLRLVRCVRNNLFHGGKHNMHVHESKERTQKLLRSCLTILAECLALSPDQQHAYDSAVL